MAIVESSHHALVAVQKSNVCATTGSHSVRPMNSDPISSVTQRPLAVDLIAQPEANFPPPGVDDAPGRHCVQSISQICVLQNANRQIRPTDKSMDTLLVGVNSFQGQ
jgi:hypothetical protein